MKRIFLLYIFLFINCTLFAQSKEDTWTAFWDKDTTHTGYKDKNGMIKIEPKFMGMTIANKFDDIIVVTEEENQSWKSYYLTKSGKIVGRDSLYIFDNGPDCENEGFIRFRDHKTDKMGMFNRDGKIVVPAEYSNLTKAINGMIIALKGAEKAMAPGTDGHFSWAGGDDNLIDINNKILIENFVSNDELNFYSVEKSKEPSKDPTRDSFLGVDGQYYSFINYDKEFTLWLKNSLLSDLSKDNLLKHSYEEIFYWKEPIGWINEPKTTFINKNYKLIKDKLLELNNPTCDYFVTTNGLNQFIYEADKYDQYFNNCNESKDWKYPIKSIIITHRDKKDSTQDHFDFLRTENGYQLISVSIRKGKLK
ncbi:hypothetical protein OIU80_17040 [Flavobacterium sp. LS1R47]|uniref:WG repeat-containing protein n=1 Tax=Flavobacterium frigoritolerans TaxID=2987686 RepID=A0A9X3C9B0_9FLAO|nr:WG repeat-containing protein [Flavobacterium frigoritolerans]MCV9933990.1 hypothetical protein [Flavobacterium frigoritolerans]